MMTEPDQLDMLLLLYAGKYLTSTIGKTEQARRAAAQEMERVRRRIRDLVIA